MNYYSNLYFLIIISYFWFLLAKNFMMRVACLFVIFALAKHIRSERECEAGRVFVRDFIMHCIEIILYLPSIITLQTVTNIFEFSRYNSCLSRGRGLWTWWRWSPHAFVWRDKRGLPTKDPYWFLCKWRGGAYGIPRTFLSRIIGLLVPLVCWISLQRYIINGCRI